MSSMPCCSLAGSSSPEGSPASSRDVTGSSSGGMPVFSDSNVIGYERSSPSTTSASTTSSSSEASVAAPSPSAEAPLPAAAACCWAAA